MTQHAPESHSVPCPPGCVIKGLGQNSGAHGIGDYRHTLGLLLCVPVLTGAQFIIG